jgi:hypothetical protein
VCGDLQPVHHEPPRTTGRTTHRRPLVHDALATFWDETVASGVPRSSLQAWLLSLASGPARNYVRRERRNPAPRRCPRPASNQPGASQRSIARSI